MNEMIERVAVALQATARDVGILKGYSVRPIEPADLVFFRLWARAAIEAMREPTDEMLAAGARYYGDNYREGHEREDTSIPLIWGDMIEAALAVPKS